MSLHVFRCDHCDHKPRLGDTCCGCCGRRVTVLNWIATHFALIIGVALAGYYLVNR